MTPRVPLPEPTPRVGRWVDWSDHRGWLCECRESKYNSDKADVCHFCGTIRPPESSAPVVETGVSEAMIDAAMREDGFGYAAISDTLPDLVAQTREWYRRILSAALRAAPTLPTPSPRFLTDAQVLGKEPIAGVDEAPLSDGSDVVQEAVNALWRAGYKFLSRDLEAKCAALRAAPVVGGEPVAWGVFLPDGHFLESFENEQAAKREAAQLHRDAGDAFAVRPLYAHPVPDADIPRIPDALMRQYEHAAEKAESVGALKVAGAIPDEVFGAFNVLIARHCAAGHARVKQEDVVKRLVELGHARADVFALGWLNVEDAYRAAGWKVVYRKPAFDESGEAIFDFYARPTLTESTDEH